MRFFSLIKEVALRKVFTLKNISRIKNFRVVDLVKIVMRPVIIFCYNYVKNMQEYILFIICWKNLCLKKVLLQKKTAGSNIGIHF